MGVDTSDDGDWLEGDFNTIGQARKRARAKGGEMTMMHVYNDKGQRVAKAGTF